jgi:hypothetical protein
VLLTAACQNMKKIATYLARFEKVCGNLQVHSPC